MHEKTPGKDNNQNRVSTADSQEMTTTLRRRLSKNTRRVIIGGGVVFALEFLKTKFHTPAPSDLGIKIVELMGSSTPPSPEDIEKIKDAHCAVNNLPPGSC